jgi:prephenate dehydrogenase
MAGSERSGPAAADPALFRGRTWAYDGGCAEAARVHAVALIEATGARPLAVAPAEHDRLVALTSHLPQVLATALAARIGRRLAEPGVAALSGPGLHSMTRLGSSAWSMWESILRENGPDVAQEVRALTSILSQAADALASGRVEAIETLFAEAARAVAGLRENAPGAPRVDHPTSVSPTKG